MSGQVIKASADPGEIRFNSMGRVVATIGLDGVFRCHVEASDEAAKQFVEAVESFLSRRLRGIEVTEV